MLSRKADRALYLTTPSTITLKAIPSGPKGISDTLDEMVTLARAGKNNLFVRLKAVDLVRNCAQKDSSCEIEQLHAFVRDQVRYVMDPDGTEMLHTPEKILEQMAGDCDDKSILLASMLKAIGYAARFVAVGPDPGVYSHVYVETLLGADKPYNWISLETTEPVAVGWAPDLTRLTARPMVRNV